MLRSGLRAAAILADAGCRQDALRLRLTVARAAIELGAIQLARRELAASSPLRRRGPVADRVETWHVQALIRLAEGDVTGAQQAARKGLRLVEDHRAALRASDLRASASETGVGLARLGLRIALADGSPGALLEWAEALRGNALRLVPVTPPKSPRLRAAITELRQVSANISRAERGGQLDPDSARSPGASRDADQARVPPLGRRCAPVAREANANGDGRASGRTDAGRVRRIGRPPDGPDAGPRTPDPPRPRISGAGGRTARVAAVRAHASGPFASARTATRGDPRGRARVS